MMDPALAKLTEWDLGLLLALREHASLGFAPREVLERIDRKLAVSKALSVEDDAALHAQIDSILSCRLESRAQVLWKLVLSTRLVFGAQDVPVTSPLGIVLLGLRLGSVPIVPETKQKITILSIEPPPAPNHAAPGRMPS